MRCPTCRRVLPDYALHCEHCAEAEPGEPAGGVAALRPQPAAQGGATPSLSHRLLTRDGPAGDPVMTSAEPHERAEGRPPTDQATAAGGRGEKALATRVVTLDREGERATRIVEVEVPAMVKRSMRQREREEGAGPPAAPRELVLLGELPAWFGGVRRQLHARDRATLWALGGCFLGAFLPWYYVRVEGLRAGVEGLGWISAALALLAVVLLVARTLRRRWALELLLAQTVLIAGAVALPTYEGIRGALGAYYLGAGLTIGAGLAALIFSLARLRRLGGA
ncbi:MAG: hypothetical protein IPL40_14110 [Proteobacteria bacterium]|nr:hypothetical protein [Pseudomonadota bacterium]